MTTITNLIRQRRIRRIALFLIAIPLGLAAIGATYEAVMAAGDSQRYPPSGRLVDVGGRRMHIDCVGQGGPTVVFEAGHGGSVIDWTLVQQQLASDVRVCAYDRAGSGWSDPGPLPRTPERVVEDLHTLLVAAGEPGPYILVGHSLGGRYVRLFAAQYPVDVAGIVLVDARSEYHDQAILAEDKSALEAQNKSGPLSDWMRRLGVMRLFGAPLFISQLPGSAKLPPERMQAAVVLSTRPATIVATGSEFAERERSDAILQPASLANLPVRVLVSAQVVAMEATWLPGQKDQAARSSNSVLRILPGSHYLQFDNPAEVAAAVMEVVHQVTR